ncbi:MULTISPECIES: helix-turn-helix transcriptional regulator [unclassified Streptomyces]|uniref:helix-turn-helix domain-containing protein n=1 Tax=Streptomyces TaxID=1883 RepID=UPI000B509ACA|nr:MULTISPECIES: helix-turn-helix transcriptional regulator [unclassified Streptomyces]MYW99906.1 helix-turn-helix domain-containing protein [Streptomyces sp. SID8378]SNB89872.1 Helix-turn-helix [Streptomyces sp. PgraA7]
MEPAKHRFLLVNPDRLRMLMARTGTGSAITLRALAAEVGVPHGTIDHLLSGEVRTQPAEVAYAISRVLGVDPLVLWAPTGRSIPADGPTPALAGTP